uniref:Uncharacterized protein n=1 Tax=Meloidogyne enterolobii TaxID=390850 RepID=A0A6V7U3A4_MELEN|nr:unnamed protein product [Meloidogyne enterolobii]
MHLHKNTYLIDCLITQIIGQGQEGSSSGRGRGNRGKGNRAAGSGARGPGKGGLNISGRGLFC